MENKHPIEGLMQTAMESIKAMVDVNTILGDPVETPDGSVVIPVSRISLGFAAGGSEYEAEAKKEANQFPFGGGTGAGISVNPVAFLVVGQGQIRLLPVDGNVVLRAGALAGYGAPPYRSTAGHGEDGAKRFYPRRPDIKGITYKRRAFMHREKA